MEIKVYTVPFKNFRRPQLLSTHACSQCLRYDDLKKRIPLEGHCATESTNKFSIEYSELSIFLQSSGTRNILKIKDVLKNGKDYKHIETLACESIETLVHKYSEQRHAVFILKKNIMINTIPLKENINCILYAEDIEERDVLSLRYKQTSNIHVLLKEEIGDQLCYIMESYVFKSFGLKVKCENLYRYLNNQHGKGQSQSNGDEILQVGGKHELDESVKILKPLPVPKHDKVIQKRSRSAENGYMNVELDEPVKNLKPLPFSKHDNFIQKRSRSAENGYMIESAEVSRDPEITGDGYFPEIYSGLKKKHHTTDRAKANGNMLAEKMHRFNKERTDLNLKAERLRIEMMGLFNRSRVPQEERPQFKDPFDDTPSDALLMDLRKLSQSIQGCAFQNRSFLVFVDDECDRDTLKSTIERVLKNHNYFCPVTFATRKVTPFSSCKVGSNITAVFDDGKNKNGTLGGFGSASSTKENKQIFLISRHVVTDNDGKPASTLNVSEDNEEAEILVDESIRDYPTQNVFDIAAASFESKAIRFNTKYKTSEGKPAKGRLTEYSRKEMEGLSVHICGSTTPNGHGTITISNPTAVHDEEMNSYILVGDTKNPQDEPFCAKGDSGAIVCSDDQDKHDRVHLISMLMGENRDLPGTYFTLDLKDGIQQVEKEIKSKIDLL